MQKCARRLFRYKTLGYRFPRQNCIKIIGRIHMHDSADDQYASVSVSPSVDSLRYVSCAERPALCLRAARVLVLFLCQCFVSAIGG